MNNLTAVDQSGKVETFQHDRQKALEADKRIRKLGRRIARCKKGSRTWTRLQKTLQSLRRNLCNGREHQQRAWANYLVHRYDTICTEKLSARNMTRSARGTSEEPGTNVKAKRGLNRSLLGIAPAKFNSILERNGMRAGTRIELVPARGTSYTCNACGSRHRNNRKSQAVYRCRDCGNEDNADANAARNVRDRGKATIRARMDASREPDDRVPEGADAGRTNDGQEQSRPLVTPSPPERAPDPGGVGGFSTPTIRAAQESWPETDTQESWPNGRIS